MALLEKLFEPAYIGTMKLQNRIIMAPMVTLYGNGSEDGSVSERLCRYYEERAKGGVGLIVVEVTAVAPRAKADSRLLAIYGDQFIPGLKYLVDSVHRHKAKIALQLHHAGKQLSVEAAGGQPAGPSVVVCPVVKVTPRELATEEVEELVNIYSEGAKRAKEAGFDAVEFHGAHGYLIMQFLSAYTNKRTDMYGRNLEGRMKFALDIVARTKEKVGDDFPLIFRLSAEEGVPHGITIDETCTMAKRLEDMGVHCLDISAGNYETWYMTMQTGEMPRGCLVPLAEKIKKVVGVPVSVAGRINDPILANTIIEEGKVDFVSLGRALLADPEFPNKAKEGKLEDIRMCTACYHCVDTVIGGVQPLTCAINATVGKEKEFALVPAGRKKKILIIGGGIAGMETARVANLRGHLVKLYEQEQTLGGQLLMAAVPPDKGELSNLTRFLAVQLDKLGVEVRLGEHVSIQTVAEIKPDAVVLASGSSTLLPKEIDGANLPHVVLARDVIMNKKKVGQKVVVVGGGRVGCETAELLASQDKEVTLTRMSGIGPLAGDIARISRGLLLHKLHQRSLTIIANSVLERIIGEGVILKVNGKSMTVRADSVVLSPAPISNDELAKQLREIVPEVHIIGDAVKPRGIFEAIHEGFRVGLEL